MALKFTVHGVQSFIKGHRKSGVISIKHSRDMTSSLPVVCFLPVTATMWLWDICDCMGMAGQKDGGLLAKGTTSTIIIHRSPAILQQVENERYSTVGGLFRFVIIISRLLY